MISQPVHEMEIMVYNGIPSTFPSFKSEQFCINGVDYKDPRWLFFKGINPWMIVMLLVVPIFCSGVLQFLTPMHSRGYLLSDYFGLIFFQPEISGRRNASMKIISFFLQFSALVFLSFYFMSLENSLRDLSTYGGHSFELDGLAGVDVWMEKNFVNSAMNTLVYPRQFEYNPFSLSQYLDLITSHPNSYYGLISSYGDSIQLLGISNDLAFFIQNLDCRYKFVGKIYSVYNVFAFGDIERVDMNSVSASVLDTIMYEDFIYSIPLEEMVPDDEAKCSDPKSVDSFVYSLHNFYELWYIYLGGLMLALYGVVIQKGLNKVKASRGEIIFEGIRGDRNRYDEIYFLSNFA